MKNKDTGSPEWWLGESFRGSGQFPRTFVQKIPDLVQSDTIGRAYISKSDLAQIGSGGFLKSDDRVRVRALVFNVYLSIV